jgi:hypothetical protein
MKQYDDFDKKLEAVMKKNLGSVHASRDLINKTLLKVSEEKQKQEEKPKKKPFIIPIPLISGIAAVLIALLGLSALFFGLRGKQTDQIIKTDTASLIKDVPKGDPAKNEIEGSADVASESEEKVESYSVKAGGTDGAGGQLSVDAVNINCYTGSGTSAGQVYEDNLKQYMHSSVDYGVYDYMSASTPFDSLNNYYFSIESKVWDSEGLPDIMDDAKNPDAQKKRTI